MSHRLRLPGPFVARFVLWILVFAFFPLPPTVAALSFRLEVIGPDRQRGHVVLALPPSVGVQGASSLDKSMHPAKALLRRVVHRNPVPYMPHAHVPEYLLCYVVETLECGHEVTVYPQGDPLIAKHRRCGDCDGQKVLPVRALKKLPGSVVVEGEERKRA